MITLDDILWYVRDLARKYDHEMSKPTETNLYMDRLFRLYKIYVENETKKNGYYEEKEADKTIVSIVYLTKMKIMEIMGDRLFVDLNVHIDYQPKDARGDSEWESLNVTHVSEQNSAPP